MTMRQYPVLAFSIGVVLFALPACSTQEIDPQPVVIPESTPGANRGSLQIAFAPREADFAAQQANASLHTDQFLVFLDGAQLSWTTGDGSLQPFLVTEGGAAGVGYLAARTHHFEIRAGVRGPTVFAGDGAIAADSQTTLYLFGPAGAVDGRFVSLPDVISPGTAHVSLINLIRSGQSLEVVACTDTSHCTPTSPPLAAGEVFAADVPMDATQDWPTGRFVVSNGAAIGYRQVPTPAVPDPPLQPLGTNPFLTAAVDSSAMLASAPVYMSAEGNVQATF